MVVVLFEVTVKGERMEDYLARAAQLRELLVQEEGFISAERFSSLTVKDKLLSMSVWRDEECAARWRSNVSHRMSQQAGRTEDFADYKITVVSPLRTYTMQDRREAPEDSNAYFEL